MTNLHPPATRPALQSRRQTAVARAGVVALGLALLGPISQAAAQAPASAPSPPKPVIVQAPPRLPPPPVASRPPAGRPAAATAPTSAARVATPAPALRAPAAVGLPLDSVRRKPAAAALAAPAPPPNAVAQCKDGTFMVAPKTASDCTSHRGLQVAMTQRAAPPAAVSRAATQPAALRAAPAAAATPPPAGATIRCRDGTYLTGTPVASACDAHAGLAMMMPVRGTPPRPVAVTSAPRPAPKGGVSAPAVSPTTKPATARSAPAKPALAKPALKPPSNP